MSKSNPFKWRHYEANIILRCVRWYCAYPLRYRQLAEMVNERGMDVHHTTVFRWGKFKEWHSCAVTDRVKFD